MRDPGPGVDLRRLEEWTVDALRRRAAELRIGGRSRMRKDELIAALRAHDAGGWT